MEKREENKKPSDEIILNINTYDEIFSDFDPRIFSQRSLSDDFLLEVKKATLEKEKPLKLRFLIPSSERNLRVEVTIKKRLNEHFKHHSKDLNQERKNTIKQGLIFTFFGILLMIITTFILVEATIKSIVIIFLSVLFEPGGWFFFWEGLNLIIFESKKKTPDLEFYEKMSKASIIFDAY